MKIAILTQPLQNNYGGNLQNFALQKVLKDMGHQPVTVDRHHTQKLRAKLKLGYFKRLLLWFLGRGETPSFKFYFSKKHEADIREEISRFIETHINKTPRLYSDSEVHSAFSNNQFDAVLVGSDQCWRPSFSPNINNYFLDFLQGNRRIKKVAYAASFGTDEWEFSRRQTELCKKLVHQFDFVSVREKEAVRLVKERFDKDAHFVLDPTMLLTKHDYLYLIKHQDITSKKGVYTYILDEADWKRKIVDRVCSGLVLENYSNQHDLKNPGHKKIPSIECWLRGFVVADFVITDSFHGTVFSIIFNKPFISLANPYRGASRFESLLSELELTERLMWEFDAQQIDALVNKNINYDTLNQKLEVLRTKNKGYLIKVL